MDANLKKLNEVTLSMEYKASTEMFRQEFIKLLESGVSFDDIYSMLELDYHEYQVKKYALAYMELLKAQEEYFSTYIEVSNMQHSIVSDEDAADKVYALILANEEHQGN